MSEETQPQPQAPSPPPDDPSSPSPDKPSLSELLDPSRLEKKPESFTVEPKAVRRNRLLGIAQLAGLAVVLAIVAIAAQALTKEKGPASDQLIAKTEEALKAPTLSARYELNVESEFETDNVAFKSLNEAGDQSIVGSISKADGHWNLSARDSDGAWEIRFVNGALYVRSGDQWTGYDLTVAEENAATTGETPESAGPGGLAAEKLPSFFSDKTYAGPVVDGTQTWELSKEIDASELPATGNIKAADLLDAISYSLSVGREDYLPRAASFQLAGDPNDWVLVPSDSETTVDLKVTAELTDWNSAPPVQAPAGVTLKTTLPPALVTGLPIYDQLFGSEASGTE